MILSINEAITLLKEYSATVDQTDLQNKINAIEKAVERGSGYTAPTDGSAVDPQAKEIVKMMLIQLWDHPDGSVNDLLANHRITYFMQQLKLSLTDGGLL